MDPPQDWHDHIKRAQVDLSSIYPNTSIKWTSPLQWHVTLAFLGEIKNAEVKTLCNALTEIPLPKKPFNLHLNDWGAFPTKNKPRVLWLGLGGDIDLLNDLQQSITVTTKSWNHSDSHPTWTPHLTLGRVRSVSSQTRSKTSDIHKQIVPAEVAKWSMNAFHLFSSDLLPEGPVYEKIKTYRWD